MIEFPNKEKFYIAAVSRIPTDEIPWIRFALSHGLTTKEQVFEKIDSILRLPTNQYYIICRWENDDGTPLKDMIVRGFNEDDVAHFKQHCFHQMIPPPTFIVVINGTTGKTIFYFGKNEDKKVAEKNVLKAERVFKEFGNDEQ